MADFPDNYYSGRDVVDREGVVYDADKTKVFFAKDHNDPVAEIEAVEAFIGTKGRRLFSSRDVIPAIADTDKMGIQDESDTKELKYTLWSTIKSTLKTYFDTLYGSLTSQVTGWILVSDSWAYASATTITVPSGAASLYQKGDKITVTANSVILYVYIVGVADTVLTVVGDDLTNHTFSAIKYSHFENPLGFPHWFSYNPTIGGFSSTTTNDVMFSINGRTVELKYDVIGTSNASTFTIPLPVNGIALGTGNALDASNGGYSQDNGSALTSPHRQKIETDLSVLSLDKIVDGTGWTTSGTKRARGSVSYKF